MELNHFGVLFFNEHDGGLTMSLSGHEDVVYAKAV